MGEISNQSSEIKIKTAIQKTNLKNYDCFFHSSSNKRGVAMLINKKLSWDPIQQYKDQHENILIIKFNTAGGNMCIGSVYGPNSTDREFYNFITNVLTENNNIPVLLGGDWNTTWDNSPVHTNIDIVNMARPPNQANGKLLHDLAEHFQLTDPFRTLFPNKIGFSYSPFGTQRKNRSRLDFFVVSISLLETIQNCDIFPAQLSSLFDHKPISIRFSDNKTQANNKNRKKIVTNWFLDDAMVKMSTELSVLQIYSKCIVSDLHPEIHNQLVRSINLLTAKLLDCLRVN
jgi:exonuclease III